MSIPRPDADADVPAFWQALGLPGLVDVHIHFMPERVLRKVRAYFDAIRTPSGAPRWPIAYRDGDEARLAHLRAMGVRAFPALLYAHKPDMAEWLNGWAADFARAHAEVVPTATFFPEEGVDRYVAEALEAGARVFKVHLQVGRFDPRDPLLAPVWRRLAEAGVPIVAHVGSGPEPGPFTGPGPIGEILARHPGLCLVVAHMGMPEYEAFLDLALRYERCHLDTTMVFTPFCEASAPFPRALLPRLAAHRERVVLGSDFPNIPHAYAQQLASLLELDLGEGWLRAVCWENGARLLGVSPDEPRAATPTSRSRRRRG